MGHNPAIEELVELLTDEAQLMPTCSLAYIKLHVDSWLDVDNESRGRALDIWLPRDFRSCLTLRAATVIANSKPMTS